MKMVLDGMFLSVSRAHGEEELRDRFGSCALHESCVDIATERLCNVSPGHDRGRSR